MVPGWEGFSAVQASPKAALISETESVAAANTAAHGQAGDSASDRGRCPVSRSMGHSKSKLVVRMRTLNLSPNPKPRLLPLPLPLRPLRPPTPPHPVVLLTMC